MTYQVTDNGEGDNDTTAGDIADPFAPMLLAPDGVGIPTLGEWGLLLMSCLLAACAMVVQSLKSNPDEHRMQPIEASHAQHLQHTAGRAHAHARLSSVSGQCSEIASDSRQRASSSSACCARSISALRLAWDMGQSVVGTGAGRRRARAAWPQARKGAIVRLLGATCRKLTHRFPSRPERAAHAQAQCMP